MAAIINTNISSLTAQRNLSMSQTALSTSMQRLSSGLRINSAKDDAAGLAISERFTTQVRGLNQASRNANDGISLSQTAEGALGEMTSNLQRIRELAVQSANSTNSASDRAALDLEVQQRLAEIDRVATQSSFNGVKILDGSFGDATFQVGANVGDTISIALSSSMRQGAIGKLATVASTVDLNTLATATPTAGTLTTGAITPTDFSSVPATAGSDTVNFAAGPVAGESVTVEGVTFTFADAVGASTVDSATAVTVNVDFTGGLLTPTQQTNALTAAFALAKADVQTSAALSTLSAANTGTLVTISDTALGTAATVGRTVTASAAVITQDVTGSDVDNTANSTITVGGTPIALTTNITSAADLVGVINAGLTAASNTTLTASAGTTANTIVFTTTATGAAATAPAAPTGLGATSLAINGAGTAVAGADSLTYTLAAGGLSVAIGTDDAVNVVADDYTTAQSFVDAVNTAMGGKGYASLDADTGLMTINSSDTVTIAGTALAALGLTAGKAATAGSLASVNVLDPGGANTAIQRVDAALTSVSTLRSTFGAIQNRFESVIANLSTTAENLSAARSRIQDADFAIETANLSRAQILQQAGTAMVAQANQLPQGVLALLRQ